MYYTLLLVKRTYYCFKMSSAISKSLKPFFSLFSLAGKSIVINCASGGMTKTVSRYLLNAGPSSLALIDKSGAELFSTAQFLREDQEYQHKLTSIYNPSFRKVHTKFTAWECDISSQNHVRDAMQAIRAQNGAPLDVLVNTRRLLPEHICA